MGKKLNIQPQFVPYMTAADLLNGAFASLSGPIGFTPEQPRIHVTGVSITSLGGGFGVVLYKGTSGGSTLGTQVLEEAPPSGTTFYPIDVILDAADFLTGVAPTSGSSLALIINITAEIEY